MQKKHALVIALAALVVAAGGVAQAADGGDLKARLQAACKNAHSFQMALSGPMGLTGETTMAGPGRMKAVMHVGPMTTTTIVADGTVYLQMNGGPWQTRALPAGAQAAMQEQAQVLTDGASLTLLPDRTEDGVAVGAYTSTSAMPLPTSEKSVKAGPSMSVTCTYDKTTLLPRTCTSTLPQTSMTMTMTYSHWNDPANVVDVPALAAAPAPAPTHTP